MVSPHVVFTLLILIMNANYTWVLDAWLASETKLAGRLLTGPGGGLGSVCPLGVVPITLGDWTKPGTTEGPIGEDFGRGGGTAVPFSTGGCEMEWEGGTPLVDYDAFGSSALVNDELTMSLVPCHTWTIADSVLVSMHGSKENMCGADVGCYPNY